MRNIERSDSEPLYDLESNEEDNLYTLPEEGEAYNIVGDDSSDDSYSEEEYSIEDYDEFDEEDDEEEDEENEGRGSVLCLMFKILATPVEGWKELKRRRYTPEEVATGCFYPMIALASLTAFAEKLYTNISWGDCLMNAVYTFISFFFGYFTTILIGGVILPKSAKDVLKGNIGKEFVMMNLSTLAFFFATLNLLPMFDPVLVFLPLWTVYLLYKGVRILRIPVAVEARTKVILVLLIVGIPGLWEWLLELIFK